MKTIGYARVSTREQSENHNALQQQESRLSQAGAEKIYTDVESGANNDRPQFNEVLKLARKGKIKTIIATRWDRLTRNEILYLELKELLRCYDITLKLLDQGEVDLKTASGELSADMQAIFAVHERRMIRERVQRGMQYRRDQKKAWMRQPFSYMIKDDKYALDTRPIVCSLEDKPDNYRDLASEPDHSPLLAGVSKSEIAREAIDYFLKVRRPRQVLKYLYQKYGAQRKTNTNLVLTEELLFWSAGQNFSNWLENPVLRGHTAYCKYKKQGGPKPSEDWEMHRDTHPDQRLITEEEWQEILHLKKSNSRKLGTNGAKFYLTGLIFCSQCGYKCILKRNPKYGYYGCRNSSIGCTNKKCLRLEKINEAIIAKLFSRALEIDSQQDLSVISAESPELVALQKQLAGLEKLLEIQPTDALKRAKHELVKQIEDLSNNSEQEDFVKATALEILSYPYAKHLGFWYTLSPKEREIVYHKVIERIEIQEGKVVSVKLKI